MKMPEIKVLYKIALLIFHCTTASFSVITSLLQLTRSKTTKKAIIF